MNLATTPFDDDGMPFIPNQGECRFFPAKIKLPAVIGVEKVIAPLLMAGFVVLSIGLILGPGKHGRPGLWSSERSLIVAWGGGGGLLLSAAIVWLLFDNYYVIDKDTGRVWLHKGLRFSGDDFPFLERGQAFLERGQVKAAGLNCAPKRSRYLQIGWICTPVLLLQDGRILKLAAWSTGMDCARLPEFNQRVRGWAAALQCYWVCCPPDQAFQASEQMEFLEAVQEAQTS